MSSALFGGSFNLVVSDDSKQKNLLNRYMRRVAIDAQFPFVKYLPGVKPASSIISDVIERTVAKRRQEMEKGISKNDILQILVDTNNADPIAFTDKHIRNEMILFMWVLFLRDLAVINDFPGLQGVIPQVLLLPLRYSNFSIVQIS